jgi:hypothetical protein
MPEIDDEVERELSSIGQDCYETVVPRLVASVLSRFESSAVLFADGSKSEAGTGFGVCQLSGEWCLHIGIVGNFNGLGPNWRSPPW